MYRIGIEKTEKTETCNIHINFIFLRSILQM